MSVLRHSPKEYARRATACQVAAQLAVSFNPARAGEFAAEALYNLALMLEALAWQKMSERFKRNDPKLS